MIRKGYVDIDAGQIHYRHAPGPGAPIVCLHQTASSGAMWERVMHAMKGEFGFFALDTPGFGGSFDPTEMPASMGVYGDWLMQAIDALGIDGFHLLGHHTGACIAVEIVENHAERVLSNTMIGPVPLTAMEREQFKAHFSTPMSPSVDGAYLSTTWEYLRALGANGDLNLHHREAIDTLRAYMGRFMAYSNVWRQDWTSMFARQQCPMLLLCAPDDVLFPYFERAKQLRPDAEFALIQGANFEPDLDPEGVASALRIFLNRSH